MGWHCSSCRASSVLNVSTVGRIVSDSWPSQSYSISEGQSSSTIEYGDKSLEGWPRECRRVEKMHSAFWTDISVASLYRPAASVELPPRLLNISPRPFSNQGVVHRSSVLHGHFPILCISEGAALSKLHLVLRRLLFVSPVSPITERNQ